MPASRTPPSASSSTDSPGASQQAHAGEVVGPERGAEIEGASSVVADHLGEEGEVLICVGEHPAHERVVHERGDGRGGAAIAVLRRRHQHVSGLGHGHG
jgi:hypothetical protein